MYFCSIVSKWRLYQFAALYNSIENNTNFFKHIVLCMDQDVLRILSLLKLKNIYLISLEEIENDDLLRVKNTRSTEEYCWTLKPVLLSYLLNRFSAIDMLMYLDADLFFFDNPKRIHKAYPKTAVLLSRHDYANELKHLEKEVGQFNSGIISFRNNVEGRSCLEWWKQKCLEWCHNTTVTGQFGDQKYLEEMPFLFENVHVIDIPGVNIAPWNDSKYNFHRKNGKLYIDDNPLIVYHYCGFRVIDKKSCVFMFGNSYIPIIHKPYVKAIKEAVDDINSVDPSFDASFIEPQNSGRFKVYSLDVYKYV